MSPIHVCLSCFSYSFRASAGPGRPVSVSQGCASCVCYIRSVPGVKLVYPVGLTVPSRGPATPRRVPRYPRGSRRHWGFGPGPSPASSFSRLGFPAPTQRPTLRGVGRPSRCASVVRVTTRLALGRLPAGALPCGSRPRSRVSSDAARTAARGELCGAVPVVQTRPVTRIGFQPAAVLDIRVTRGRPGPAAPVSFTRPATGCQPWLRPSPGCPLERAGPPALRRIWGAGPRASGGPLAP